MLLLIGVALVSLGYGIGLGIHLGTFVLCMQQDYGTIADAPKELKRACLVESVLWPIRMIWPIGTNNS